MNCLYLNKHMETRRNYKVSIWKTFGKILGFYGKAYCLVKRALHGEWALTFIRDSRYVIYRSNTVGSRIYETAFQDVACCFRTIAYCFIYCFLRNWVSQFLTKWFLTYETLLRFCLGKNGWDFHLSGLMTVFSCFKSTIINILNYKILIINYFKQLRLYLYQPINENNNLCKDNRGKKKFPTISINYFTNPNTAAMIQKIINTLSVVIFIEFVSIKLIVLNDLKFVFRILTDYGENNFSNSICIILFRINTGFTSQTILNLIKFTLSTFSWGMKRLCNKTQ